MNVPLRRIFRHSPDLPDAMFCSCTCPSYRLYKSRKDI
ncbi:MAG: hypothetical protein IKH75_03885 [Ruminococcus sp.]|nr:hypothetical protein [Ruminococcus sp.]